MTSCLFKRKRSLNSTKGLPFSAVTLRTDDHSIPANADPYRRILTCGAASPAMASRAWRTEVFPEPFGPRSRVKGANGRVTFRRALKLVNSIDSIIAVSPSMAVTTSIPWPNEPDLAFWRPPCLRAVRGAWELSRHYTGLVLVQACLLIEGKRRLLALVERLGSPHSGWGSRSGRLGTTHTRAVVS